MKFDDTEMLGTQTISINAKLKEAAKHSIIYGIGSVMQSASALILLPILTDALSKEDFGAYSLILMVTSIASAVFYFGMTSALPRSYFDYESTDDRRAVFTTAFVILLVGVLLQSMLGFLFSAEISKFLVNSSQYAGAVCYALMGGALGFLNNYFFGYLRLLRKSVASVLFSITSLVLTIGLTLALLSSDPISVTAPFEAVVYVQAIIAFSFIIMYGKVAFVLRIKKEELANLLQLGVISIVASFGGLLLESLDRLMIQHYMGLVEVGVFSAAIRVSALISVILIVPFSQIWSPMMMEYRKKHNVTELFSKIFSWYMMMGGIFIVIGSLFASQFLPILIRSGVDAAVISIFITCMLGLLIFSATNFLSAGLIYERRVYLLPIAYYGVVLIKYILNLMLIPMLGLLGATLSALLSYVTLPVFVYLLARNFFSFRIEWKRLSLLMLLITPSLLFGYYSAFFNTPGVAYRILVLFITVFLIFRFFLSHQERLMVKSFVDKLMLKNAQG